MAVMKKKSLFQRELVVQACIDSLKKLHPIHLMKNPVIFVTEVGAAITTAELLFRPERGSFSFNLQIALWLWFTVLFANFAEAMAEGRGKAQAESLRTTRRQTYANLMRPDGGVEKVLSGALRRNDLVTVSAGEIIPADGEIVRAESRMVRAISLGVFCLLAPSTSEIM
jgi:potassium-transporting ATPase ATP-binding subunit